MSQLEKVASQLEQAGPEVHSTKLMPLFDHAMDAVKELLDSVSRSRA